MRIVLASIIALAAVAGVLFLTQSFSDIGQVVVEPREEIAEEKISPISALDILETPEVKVVSPENSEEIPSNEAPTNLQAFANSASIIYLNWKDNSIRKTPYQFQVQRMPLDMPQSTNFTATSTGENSITLKWKNSAVAVPYYGSFKRSLSPDFASPSYISDSGQVYEPYGKGPAMNIFSYTDAANLSEATTYYYKARVCAAVPNVKSAYMKEEGSMELNANKPDTLCGPYTAETKSATTKPKAPTNLTANNVATTSIELQWNDNSQKDTRYEIYRNGVLIKKFDEYDKKGTPTGLMKYIDAELSSGTKYSYSVHTYRDLPAGGYVYSTSNQLSQTTDFIVTLTKSGDGKGTVASTPAGIDCGPTCLGQSNLVFDSGTKLTLTAVPVTDSSNPTDAVKNYAFAGWSGSCSGAGTCEISGNAAIEAMFTKKYYVVTVTTTPAIGGTVTDGVRIVCGTTCSSTFARGSQVSVTANPDAGYIFHMWSGDTCISSKEAMCKFNAEDNINLIAGFAPMKSTVAVSFNPGGANGNKVLGTVYVRDTRNLITEFACQDSSTQCENQINSGTDVELNAVPASGYSFTGWVGASCGGGKNPCLTPIWGDQAIIARFDSKTAGAESGEISLPMPGISPLISQISDDAKKLISLKNTAAEILSPVAGGEYAASIYGVASEKIKSAIEFIKNIFTAHGQTIPAIAEKYANYFQNVASAVSGSSYIDNGKADTVYIYRVRLCPRKENCSNWSNIVAAKTLAQPVSLNEDKLTAPVCTANNLCNLSIKQYGPNKIDEKSERQCLANADCANIGRPKL